MNKFIFILLILCFSFLMTSCATGKASDGVYDNYTGTSPMPEGMPIPPPHMGMPHMSGY